MSYHLKKYFLPLFFCCGVLFTAISCKGLKKVQEPQSSIQIIDLAARLNAIPGISKVKQQERNSNFEKNFELWFEQPLDHDQPNGPKFQQRVLLGHVGYQEPCVVEIQGYGINSENAGELATLLDANQIKIEHRFFFPSAPDSIPWDLLTVRQAAIDQHKIILKIKKALYPNSKFISTGISKGGQCTMFHRSMFPDDVDASVVYVAPLNLSREDPRIYEFLKTVGNERQRQQIFAFQEMCFKRKAGLVKQLNKLQVEHNYSWNMLNEKAVDYYILEYSFAFWQWGTTKFVDIPTEEDSDETILKHLLDVSGLSFFEESGVEDLRPFFWSALTEIGMYGYETEPFEEYLGTKEPYLFDFTAPRNTTPVYNPEPMQKVNEYLQKRATNMLYIYGELDTWSATAVELTTGAEARDNYVMTLANGHHGTRISNFGERDREFIYALLSKWSDKKIVVSEF